MRKLILCCLFICQISLAETPALQQWQADSLTEVLKNHPQQPFLLVFWSLECPACYQELAALNRWQKKYPASQLILVATDSLDLQKEVFEVITAYQLNQAELWVFSDQPNAKLRKNIDPTWFGELPRSYFYNSQHQISPHSGQLTDQQLSQWQAYISK